MTRTNTLFWAIATAAFIAPMAWLGKHEVKKPSPMGWGNEETIERLEYERRKLVGPDGTIPANIREKELAFAATLPSDAMLPQAKNFSGYNTCGPFNHGGRTRALAFDVTNENVILAGPVSGGLWRSTDGGQSWNRSSALNQIFNVTCLSQDTRTGKTNTWYYGTGEAFGNSASGGEAFFLGNGIFKSDDGGNTWAKLSSTGASSPQGFDNVWELVWNVKTDPSNSTEDEVYAATYGAVWRSINGGTSWTVVRGNSSGNSYSYFSDVLVTPLGVVYATLSSDGPQGGIWRSEDGTNWANITPQSFGQTYDRIVMNYNPQNPNEVWFLGVTPGSGQTSTNFYGEPEQNSLWKYTYLSGDGSGTGGQWDNRSAQIPANLGQFDNFNAQGGYNLFVAVKPDDANTVFIGGTNIFRSTDGFTSTQNTTQIGGYAVGTTTPFFNSYATNHPDQHNFMFVPSNPNQMIVANDGGLFKTQNCMAQSVVWDNLNRGYLSNQFYTLAINKETPGDPIIIGGTQDNGTLFTNNYLNPQNDWVLSFNGDGAHCYITNDGQTYYYSRQLGQVAKTTMNTTTGQVTGCVRIDPILADTNKYLFINPFVVDPTGENTMYMGGDNRLWRNRSLNQFNPTGFTFTRTNQGWDFIAGTLDTTRDITAIEACKTPAHRVYYGTDQRKLYRIDNAESNSPNVVEITSTAQPSVMPASGYVSDIAVNPSNSDEVMVVFSNYSVYSVFYSTDAGDTWTRIAGNLEQTPTGGGNGPSVRSCAIMNLPNGNKAYFVGTSTGLYATSTLDGLNTVWVQQGANTMGNAIVTVLETRDADGLLVVATHSNGVFTATIDSPDDLTNVEDLTQSPVQELTVYPNPATANAQVTFTTAKSLNASLTLVDDRGRLVRTLHNGQITQGKNSFTVDRNGLANGLYYCVLTTNRRSYAKQLVLTQ